MRGFSWWWGGGLVRESIIVVVYIIQSCCFLVTISLSYLLVNVFVDIAVSHYFPERIKLLVIVSR